MNYMISSRKQHVCKSVLYFELNNQSIQNLKYLVYNMYLRLRWKILFYVQCTYLLVTYNILFKISTLLYLCSVLERRNNNKWRTCSRVKKYEILRIKNDLFRRDFLERKRREMVVEENQTGNAYPCQPVEFY